MATHGVLSGAGGRPPEERPDRAHRAHQHAAAAAREAAPEDRGAVDRPAHRRGAVGRVRRHQRQRDLRRREPGLIDLVRSLEDSLSPLGRVVGAASPHPAAGRRRASSPAPPHQGATAPRTPRRRCTDARTPTVSACRASLAWCAAVADGSLGGSIDRRLRRPGAGRTRSNQRPTRSLPCRPPCSSPTPVASPAARRRAACAPPSRCRQWSTATAWRRCRSPSTAATCASRCPAAPGLNTVLDLTSTARCTRRSSRRCSATRFAAPSPTSTSSRSTSTRRSRSACRCASRARPPRCSRAAVWSTRRSTRSRWSPRRATSPTSSSSTSREMEMDTVVRLADLAMPPGSPRSATPSPRSSRC